MTRAAAFALHVPESREPHKLLFESKQGEIMRKFAVRSVRCALLLLLLSPSVSFSQATQTGEKPGHIFVVTMFKIPLGQVSDFMGYWEKVFVPLEKEDADLVSSVVMRHRMGPTDYSVVLIQEFKDLAAVESSRNREEGPLLQRSASDPQAAEIMKKFGEYVNGHVDYVMFGPDAVAVHK